MTLWGGGSLICHLPASRTVAWSEWLGQGTPACAVHSSHRVLQTLGTRTGLEMHSGTTLHPTSVGVVRECTHTDMERDIYRYVYIYIYTHRQTLLLPAVMCV